MDLLESDVDLFVVDASDGHTEYAADTVRWLKSHGDVPVIAGNVITAAGFDYLAEAGADAIKVGMGIGSGRTTQWVRATGRGQASALVDVTGARDRHLGATGDYLPIIADGGITGAAQLVIALALGADCAVLGNPLARHTEAPGELVTGAKGQQYKAYWMEGSRRARNARRYGATQGSFIEEGVEGAVPHAGSIYEGLPALMQAVRAALHTAGCADLTRLRRDGVVELQSSTSREDGAVHNMVLA